ncbi:MAG: hypothetical protein R3F43_27475 [bacterium]
MIHVRQPDQEPFFEHLPVPVRGRTMWAGASPRPSARACGRACGGSTGGDRCGTMSTCCQRTWSSGPAGQTRPRVDRPRGQVIAAVHGGSPDDDGLDLGERLQGWLGRGLQAGASR